MINNIALAVVLAGGLAMAQAPAPTAQVPTKIGVINLQQAIPATAQGQAAVAKLQKEFVEPRTKALEAMQTEIKDLNEKLQRGGNTLSQIANDDLQNEINKKTKVLNRAVEDYEADAEEQQRRLLADLSAKFQTVMIQFGRDNAFAAIFDSGNQNAGLVWNSDAVEITQAVIEAFDKANPSSGGAAAARPAVGGAKPLLPTNVKPTAPPPASTSKPPVTPPKPGQ